MTVMEMLAALVRGDNIPAATWRAVAVDGDADAFCRAADHHGVVSLVAEQMRTRTLEQTHAELQTSTHDSAWPRALAIQLQDLARRHAATDLARELALRVALEALDKAGVRPLLFKGAHLAYSDYARPDLRPRLDTDLLIPPDAASRESVHAALIGLGYETPAHVGGDLVMTQRAYVKRRGSHALHAIDVHWRIANPQPFARVLEYEELARGAVPLPALSALARGLSGPHALLIACVHRIAHHADADALIWLYDIDRIARRLHPGEWTAFEALAIDRKVAHVCDVSLRRTMACFATPVPAQVLAALGRQGAAGRELSGEYLIRRSSFGAALRDWRALGSWRDRLRLAGEHLLPPADYMRTVYAPSSRAPLAWLYVRRAVRGARGWLTYRT